jgi:hypothetical protein
LRFIDPEDWHGGAVALVILAGSRAELGTAAADARVDEVLRAVWAAPGLEGPHARRDLSFDGQPVVAPGLATGNRLSGLARLPTGSTAFATQVARDHPGEHDWVYADLPIGGLDRLGIPEDAPEAREFLLGVARAVYDVTPFAAAGIGHEVQGPDVSTMSKVSGVRRRRAPGTS